MKNSVIVSVKVTTILSVIFFIASIFDELFLPLGFYVWNLLPGLLVLDFIFWGTDELFDRFNNKPPIVYQYKSSLGQSNDNFCVKCGASEFCNNKKK